MSTTNTNDATNPNKSSITYRWLENNEAEVLKHINITIANKGWTKLPAHSLLNQTYRILCAFVSGDGIPIGWIVVQLFVHPEPIWVHHEYRGTDNNIAATLAEKVFNYLLESNTRGFMVVADNPVAVQLCERFGMRRVESPVFIGG